MTRRDVEMRVYTPNPNLVQAPPDLTECRYSVPQPNNWGYRQCSRKPVETVAGYGFCKQHAKRARSAEGRSDD